MRGSWVEEEEWPDVKAISAGNWAVVARVGVPVFQFHAIRYQKLFWILIEPPVVNRRRSQCCARAFKFFITPVISL
jgi:hypothetical protein